MLINSIIILLNIINIMTPLMTHLWHFWQLVLFPTSIFMALWVMTEMPF